MSVHLSCDAHGETIRDARQRGARVREWLERKSCGDDVGSTRSSPECVAGHDVPYDSSRVDVVVRHVRKSAVVV